MVNCQAFDKSFSLMDYILMEIHARDENFQEFIPNMLGIMRKASEFELDGNFLSLLTIKIDCLKNLNQYKNNFNKMKVHIENSRKANPNDEGFIRTFQPFFGANAEKLITLESEASSLPDEFIDLLVYLGDKKERLHDVKTDETLKAFIDIFRKIEESWTKHKNTIKKLAIGRKSIISKSQSARPRKHKG